MGKQHGHEALTCIWDIELDPDLALIIDCYAVLPDKNPFKQLGESCLFKTKIQRLCTNYKWFYIWIVDTDPVLKNGEIPNAGRAYWKIRTVRYSPFEGRGDIGRCDLGGGV
jgi:hypothetical protein